MDGGYGAACPLCGACVAYEDRPATASCPRCGAASLTMRPLVGGSLLYTFADRRQGPAPEDEELLHLALWAGLLHERRAGHARWEHNQRLQEAHSGSDEPADGPPGIDEILAERGWLNADRAERLVRLSSITSLADCDGRFCQLAVRKGLLTREQLDSCRAEQQRLLDQYGQAPLIEFLALRRGYLSPAQVGAILEEEAREGVSVVAAARCDARQAARARKVQWLGALRETIGQFREQHPLLRDVTVMPRSRKLGAVLAAIVAVSLLVSGLSRSDPWPDPMPLRYLCTECGHEFVPSARQIAKASEPIAEADGEEEPQDVPRGLLCPSCLRATAFRAYQCGAPDCGKWFVPKSALGPVEGNYAPTCPHCGWQPAVRPAK